MIECRHVMTLHKDASFVTMSHKCYVCAGLFQTSALRYECKCYDQQEPHYRGVCKACATNRSSEIRNPAGHHLAHLHDLNDANLQELRRLEEEAKLRHGFDAKAWAGGCMFKNDTYTLTMKRDPHIAGLVEVPVTSLEEYKRLTKCTCCA